MKVVVFGASGFIGFAVAQALLRAGHTVYGQTRSQSKAKQFAADEIIPVIADPEDVQSWRSIVESADAVIDALSGIDPNAISNLLAAVGKISHERSTGSPKITYLYTSGTWVHGNEEGIVTDTTPIKTPARLIAWRPAVELEVVNHKDLNGIVIRPSMLYGRSGSIFALMFQRAHDGKLTWPGKPGGRLAVIHQDDLADLYVRATEKGALVKGTIFDATENTTESTDEVLTKLVKVVGLKEPYEYVEPANLFEEAVATSAIVRPYLARTLLGWEPRRHGLLEDLELYYTAWKANAGLL